MIVYIMRLFQEEQEEELTLEEEKHSQYTWTESARDMRQGDCIG